MFPRIPYTILKKYWLLALAYFLVFPLLIKIDVLLKCLLNSGTGTSPLGCREDV
jgi:hypothetical protein